MKTKIFSSILVFLALVLTIHFIDCNQIRKRLTSDTLKAIRDRCAKENIDRESCKSMSDMLSAMCNDKDECVMKMVNQISLGNVKRSSPDEELQNFCAEQNIDKEECDILELVCDGSVECIQRALNHLND